MGPQCEDVPLLDFIRDLVERTHRCVLGLGRADSQGLGWQVPPKVSLHAAPSRSLLGLDSLFTAPEAPNPTLKKNSRERRLFSPLTLEDS